MEIRHLKYFQKVASTQNISHAAEMLNISQSSVTRAIQEIENEANTLLLCRNPTGVTLTAAGKKFYIHTNRILALINEAIRDVKSECEQSKKINIGFCPGILAFELIDTLRNNAYDVSALHFFEFDFHEQIQALRNEQLDVALVRYSNGMHFDGGYADLAYIPFKRLRVHAVLPVTHRFAGKKSLLLEELRNEVFVTLPESQYGIARRVFLENCDRAGFVPRIAVESNGFLAALATVAAGSCIGLFSKSIVSATLPGLIYVPIADEACYIEISCVYKKEEKRAHALEFINVLRSCFDE
ncbi:LysR family transcriptional regulator [Desulfovibrio sp.]|uniref:LysR family transcriptional regulator n=1 Tax=Desulfovibrio sp. TaxID=885 RepID=UPI0025BBB4C7|nr:LysR family transcriptional regulator [Desulfovibrio sp.]